MRIGWRLPACGPIDVCKGRFSGFVDLCGQSSIVDTPWVVDAKAPQLGMAAGGLFTLTQNITYRLLLHVQYKCMLKGIKAQDIS